MKTKVSMIIIVQCLLMGIMSPSYAQSGFTKITSNESVILYFDNTRIVKYVNSRLQEGWVKKVFTEQDRVVKKKRKASKAEKEQAALLKKTSYQLIHQQFDPRNFKYKILEVYSYDAKGKLLASNANQSSWLTIPVDSIEEKTMLSMSDYIQNNVDKVMMK